MSPAPDLTEEECAAALAESLATAHPRPDWQQRTWSRLARRQSRRRRLLLALPLAAAVAVVLVFLVRPREQELVVMLTIASERPAAAGRTRGDLAAGDTLVITVDGLPSGGQLRVYRDDGSLVAACDRDAPCVQHDRRVTARFPAIERGRLRVLVVRGGPPPRGRYDEDTAALLDRGGKLVISRTMEVP